MTVNIPSTSWQEIVVAAVATLPSAGSISLKCHTYDGAADDAAILATKVGAVH
jgi:hypothetical protein